MFVKYMKMLTFTEKNQYIEMGNNSFYTLFMIMFPNISLMHLKHRRLIKC